MMSFENSHYRIFLHWEIREIMARIVIVRKTLPKSKYTLKKTKILYSNKTSKEELTPSAARYKFLYEAFQKGSRKTRTKQSFMTITAHVVVEGSLFFWFMKLHWASSSTCPPEGGQMYNQRAKNTPSDWAQPTNPNVYSDLLHAKMQIQSSSITQESKSGPCMLNRWPRGFKSAKPKY